MDTKVESVNFEALDACQRQNQVSLTSLAALAGKVEADGIDGTTEREAAAFEACFSGTSRQHHADEEKFVTPPLLTGDDEGLAHTARMLQLNRGGIEENWIELAPQLPGIASGTQWVDPIGFVREVDTFNEMLQGHIAFDESMIYPESKAHLVRALERRLTARPR